MAGKTALNKEMKHLNGAYFRTIISKKNMKHLKKNCIYFIVIFTIAVACGFAGLVIKEVNKGTFYDLPTEEALSFCVQLGLTAFTSLIPYSLSVATFLVFWAMDREKWTGFFRTLAIGLILVLPLSAMTYYYDWFVRPQMMVISVGKIVDMNHSYPRSLADKYGISIEQILNKKPMSMSKTKLIAQIDSLETSFQADIDTCGLLLSILPDTLASKAYDSYRLREIGVVYQDAVHPVANEDSLRLVAHTELYQHAIGAWETSNELRRHRLEYFGRTLNTGYIYIAYILFAFLGYLLRFKPIKKILAVFAILIVAAWIYHEINSIVQEYAKKLNTESHQIVDDTYKEIDAIRESKQREMKTDTQLE
jgi:hypothetical protein